MVLPCSKPDKMLGCVFAVSPQSSAELVLFQGTVFLFSGHDLLSLFLDITLFLVVLKLAMSDGM